MHQVDAFPATKGRHPVDLIQGPAPECRRQERDPAGQLLLDPRARFGGQPDIVTGGLQQGDEPLGVDDGPVGAEVGGGDEEAHAAQFIPGRFGASVAGRVGDARSGRAPMATVRAWRDG